MLNAVLFVLVVQTVALGYVLWELHKRTESFAALVELLDITSDKKQYLDAQLAELHTGASDGE